MEERKDANFVCKICNKKYSCGKSLGGHLKSHRTPKSSSEEKSRVMVRTDDETEGQSGEGKSKRKLGFEDGDSESAGYGLRENPKKTKRFAGELGGSRVSEKEMMKCKTCGKGFQNMKALCGHMACHSKAKSNGSIQDGVELGSEKKKSVVSSPIRAEKSNSGGKSKSKRTRCQSADVRTDEDSSSLSEIEKELEGLARCLIMLSRDDGKRPGILRSLSDLSDKNLTAKEVKPSSKSNNARPAGVKGLKCGSKDVKLSGMKKPGDSEVKSTVQCSDDGKKDEHIHLLSGKVDSQGSIDDLTKIRELKEPKKKLRPKAVDTDVKVKVQNCGKVGHKSEKENCIIDEEVSSKPVNFDCQSHGYVYSDHNEMPYSSFHPDICGSAQIIDSKCKCLMLDKVFDSSKTQGEHISCHIRSNGYFCSDHGIAANKHKTNSSNVPVSIPTHEAYDFHCCNDQIIKKFPNILLKSVPLKKSEGHECPMCLRIFHSAQALGSHKRSHFPGLSKENEDHEQLTNEVPVPPMVIDLNLPAAVEEDPNADAGMFPW